MSGDHAAIAFNRANPVTEVVERVPRGGATAVRKVLRPDGEVVVGHWVTSDDPRHWNHWRREDRAYATGLVDAFAAEGIRGPRLLERHELDDGSVALVLEDVAGRPGPEWAAEDHARFAGRLGAAQGRLGRPGAVPRLDWLSRGWLRQYTLSRPGQDALRDPAAWEHPVVVQGWGDARHRIRARFTELWDDADRWIGLVESLPRTLCHLDCWANNAVAADDGTDVLVDWAFVGDGAVGEDVGNWVPDGIFDFFAAPEDFASLDRAVWSNYAEGLDRSGWPYDPDLARLAMCAGGALKYVWLPGLMVSRAGHGGPTGYGGRAGPDEVDVFAHRLGVFDGLLAWLDEAAALADSLGLD
jgi:hypothetical protein